MRRVAYLLAASLALAEGRAAPRNPLDALRLQDLSATRERPLFRPSRRPAPPVAVAAPEPAPQVEPAPVVPPPPLDLIGVVVGPQTAIALFRDRTTNQITRLRLGEDAAGWRLATIGARSAAFERDGRRQSLALAPPSAPPAGAELAGEPDPPEAPLAPPDAGPKRVANRMRPDP